MSKIADYYDGMDEIREHSGNDGIFKISPSSIADFFTNTAQYFYEQVEGNEKAFQGSTSTYLGTIVHHIAEMAVEKSTVTSEDVEQFLSEINDPNVDKDDIRKLYNEMGSILVANTVNDFSWDIVSTEQFIFEKLNDDVYVGGTYDALRRDPATNDGYCVVDYKTASTKPSGINLKYRYQAYTYAWMLRQRNINVTSIELCYVTRPTKTLPVRYFNFKEEFNEVNYDFIDSTLKLIAKCVSMYKQKPELRAIIAKDARLLNDSTTESVAFPI